MVKPSYKDSPCSMVKIKNNPRPTTKAKKTTKGRSGKLQAFLFSSKPKALFFVLVFGLFGVTALGLTRAQTLDQLLRSLNLNLAGNSKKSNQTDTTAAGSCGGAVIPKATGGYWQCTFADEFNGTTLDRSKWIPQVTATSSYHSGAECFVDTPNNISVAGGTLNLTVRKEAAPFTCKGHQQSTTQYTSGMVMTYKRFSQAYGRFEVRAKLPDVKVKGLQESFWLWPDNPTKYGYWPRSGEIDIAEIYHLYPDRAIPFIHYYPATVDHTVTNNYCLINDISQFHTYTAEWTPEKITIIYDGKVCLTHHINPAAPLKAPQPFDHPFMIALTQALGIGKNAFDPKITPLPATTQIDYVRVWK